MTALTVEVNGLVKSYGPKKAVDGISFGAERGEVLGILGPNGAGKTTTLECMEGLLKPDSGTIGIAGMNPSEGGKAFRMATGVQLQTSGLPEDIRAGEALELFCTYHGIKISPEFIAKTGLREIYGCRYSALSTGQKRRLSIAIAAAHNPGVLFLDEPTAGLDVNSRAALHSMIRELKGQGTTVILATHDMAEAEQLSDRIIILLNGRIAEEGSPRSITAAGNGLSRISLKTGRGLTNPESISGAYSWKTDGDYFVFFTRNTAEVLQSIIKATEESQDAIEDLRVERPSLEERFLEITGEKTEAFI